MNKTVIIIVILAIVGIGAYYFINSGPKGNTSTYTNPITNNSNTNTSVPTTQSPTTPVPTTPTTPIPTSVMVSIKNFSFSPLAQNIKIGTKVTWVNNDTVPHTVTSDSGSILNSPTLSPGQSFSFTFTNVGSVSYHCSIHPMMKGTITVTN